MFLETAERGQAKFPHAVLRILRAALDLRDRRDRDLISPHGLLVAGGRLEAKTDRVLGVEATNWMGEHAMRPAVVNRKVWGGNRTLAGAHAQEVLTSFLRNCHRQQRDPCEMLRPLLLSRTPRVADLRLAAGLSPPSSPAPSSLAQPLRWGRSCLTC